MKQATWTVPGIVAGVTLLAACGGSGGGTAAAAGCDGKVDPGTVTMFAHEGAEADAYKAAVDDFNKGPGKDLGVKVDLTMIPEGQYTDQVNSAAASGDLPAVLDMDGPNMANLAWSGNLVPIDDCISKETKSNMLPSLVQQGTYANHLWSVATFDSGLGLYAYKSALEEVGARIPTSADDAWSADELEKILRDLQKAGYQHPLDTKFWYGSQGEWFSYAFDPIIWSAGGDVIDRSDYQSADGKLNSPAVVDAMTQFQSWVKDGLIDKDAADDSNFLKKKAPISWVGHWMYQTYKDKVGDDLVLLPLPDWGTGSKTGMGSWAWGMSPNASDPDAAWAVMKYLISDDAIGKITEVNGAVPGTKTSIDKSDLYAAGGPLNLFVQQLQAAPDVAVPRPVTPAYPAMTKTMTRTIDDIVQGADVKKTLDKAVKTIDSDIKQNEGYPPPKA